GRALHVRAVEHVLHESAALRHRAGDARRVRNHRSRTGDNGPRRPVSRDYRGNGTEGAEEADHSLFKRGGAEERRRTIFSAALLLFREKRDPLPSFSPLPLTPPPPFVVKSPPC